MRQFAGVRLGVLALVLAGGSAQAEVDVYGKLNVTLQNSDEAGTGQIEVQSNNSRVGVKGDEALNGGLKAIYQLEWEVDFDGESGDDNLSARDQFVGLEGALGAIKVGRHNTALKNAQGDFDLFNDLEGDIKNTFNGENRLKDYVGYTTPTLTRPFSVSVNFFPGENPGAGNDGVADGTSIALAYDSDTIYTAVARDWNLDGEGVDTTRLVGGYTLGSARVMLLYQHTDTGAADEDGVGVSVAYGFGRNTAKLQYLDANFWRTDPQADPLDDLLDSQLSIGLDHELGKNTTLFGFYTTGDIGGTAASDVYLAIGLEHDF